MKTVLLAVSSQSMAKALTDALSEQYTVIACLDGMEAVDELNRIRPDMMLTDLMISGIDGVSVLQAAWDMGLRIPTIVISTYFSDYTIAALECLKVSCLIRLPCDPAYIAAKIHSLDAFGASESREDRRIREMLGILGLRLNTGGYRAAVAALHLLLEDPNRKLTTELYPLVAQQCNGTPTQVEKAIRYSIETAWKSCNQQIWKIYFKVGKNGKVVKPTNADFLHRLVMQIWQEKEEQCVSEKDSAVG